jgi:predicted Zn-ribbon and HTH transcriptional regulator
MFARKKSQPNLYLITQQCQDCDGFVRGLDIAEECPDCRSTEAGNLVVLYMEEDSDRSEWLQLVDFSAGD